VLQLDERWVWDFWTVDDGKVTDAFFLNAPTAMGDPDLRHWDVTVGHATSTDLVHWTVLSDTLAPPRMSRSTTSPPGRARSCATTAARGG
jgi:beta-fructofuranosidase